MAFLENYEKLRLIGKGAFATIWKVRHKDLEYIRAIKVLNEMVENKNDKAYQTFLKECRVLLKIGNGCHPNIVRIYQPDLIENKALVEMDYVEGYTLNEYISKNGGYLPMEEIDRFIRNIVGALAYCHSDIYRFLMNPSEDHLTPDPVDARRYIIDEEKKQELIKKYQVNHNDLHSNNIMRRDYDGCYILLDFGLAIQDGHAVKSSSRRDGALEYSAPEKWNNGEITCQTDIYSLGVLLFEVMTGRVPFPMEVEKYSNDTECLNALYHNHLEKDPPEIEPLRKKVFEDTHPDEVYIKDYPDWLEDMIKKCLAKNPVDRYVDAKAVLEDYKIKYTSWEKQLKFQERQETEQISNRIEELKKIINDKEGMIIHLEDNLRESRQLNATKQDELDSLKNQLELQKAQDASLTTTIGDLRREKKNNERKHGIWKVLNALFCLSFIGVGVFCYEFYDKVSFYEPGYFALQQRLHENGDSVYVNAKGQIVKDIMAPNEEIKSIVEPPIESHRINNQMSVGNTDSLKVIIADLKKAKLSLEQENKKLKNVTSAPAKGNEAELRQQISTLTSRNNSLTSENASLKRQNQNLQNQNASLSAKVKRFNEVLSN